MRLLRVLPAAKRLINREQLDLRERAGILGRNLFIAWAVVVLCSNLLPLGRVEELKVRLGDGLRPLLRDDLVDDGNGRFE